MKLLLSVILTTFCFGSHAQTKFVDLQPTSTGKLVYMANVDGKYQKVENTFVLGLAEDALKKAKELACGLKLRPDSVDASIGVISFSWDTEKLCKK
ncbi:MAG: hypothetical protein GY909_06780 [Oligoflexia bacterium]|nr:hypothetical protein [Oligoflexia bacterium]